MTEGVITGQRLLTCALIRLHPLVAATSPKGEVLLYLPADAEKLPLSGELAKPTGFD